MTTQSAAVDTAARVIALATEAANTAANLGKAKASASENAKSMPELLDLIGATTEATPAAAIAAVRACLPLSEAIETAAKKKCLAVSVVWRNHSLKKAFSARFAYNLKYNKAEGFTLGAAVSDKAAPAAAAVKVDTMSADSARAILSHIAPAVGHDLPVATLSDTLRGLFSRFTPAAIAEAMAVGGMSDDAAELAAHLYDIMPAQINRERAAMASLAKTG